MIQQQKKIKGYSREKKSKKKKEFKKKKKRKLFTR
jgi:hypothetical protein